MAQPQLIHRRNADPLSLPSAVGWAVAAIQQALLALVDRHESAQPGSVERLLTAGPGPESLPAWSEHLSRALDGLPDPAAPAAFVVAAQARNPALAPYTDVLAPIGMDEELEALLERALLDAGVGNAPSLGTLLLAPGRATPTT